MQERERGSIFNEKIEKKLNRQSDTEGAKYHLGPVKSQRKIRLEMGR